MINKIGMGRPAEMGEHFAMMVSEISFPPYNGLAVISNTCVALLLTTGMRQHRTDRNSCYDRSCAGRGDCVQRMFQGSLQRSLMRASVGAAQVVPLLTSVC